MVGAGYSPHKFGSWPNSLSISVVSASYSVECNWSFTVHDYIQTQTQAVSSEGIETLSMLLLY